MQALPDGLKDLQRSINELRIENYITQRFIPEDKLCELLSPETLKGVLGNICPAYLSEEFVDFVHKRAPKVFGVLVLINQVGQINKFIQNDQFGAHRLDHQLPFTLPRLEKIFEDDYVAGLFHEKQWEFIAPTFSGQVTPRNLERWTIMPYLSETHLATGGYGSVYKVTIHPSYHPPAFKGITEFVRKELDLHDSTFENEARILSTLQRLRHPNILLLIGCYTYRLKHNFIAPFIKGGTLKTFLDQPKSSNLSREEMFCALAGLASAIWALHEFVLDDSEPSMKGHHQDLRPDNILVDGLRFILADFGLSSIKSKGANSRTTFKGRKGYYQAPECAELMYPYQEHEATRATDIFAFACIIADCLVYLLDGPSGVQKFRDDREFRIAPLDYKLYHKGDTLNEAVTKALKRIADKDKSQSMQDIVRLVTRMLEIAPAKRPNAALVTANLYTSTIGAFSEDIVALFAALPSSWDVIIEKSRFLSWQACQNTELFLSMPGATTTNGVFESTVKLLRQASKALKDLDGFSSPLDRRSLLEVRALNTQLLNMLSPESSSTSRSQLESTLLVEIESAKLNVPPALLESAFGNSKIVQKAETKKLVALAQVEDVSATQTSVSFREILSSEFTKQTSGNLRMARWHNGRPGQSLPMLLETVQYQDPLTGRKLLPRFHALCSLLSNKTLSQQLRIPPLFALCNNTSALCYDLLYEYPRPEGSETHDVAPISLFELLTERKVANFPSLGSRFKLSLDLAEALGTFHDVSWFHKDLTSSNILFFVSNSIAPATRIRNPYLFGFQHSRNSTDDFTEGPLQDKKHQRYHHHEYISVENYQFKRFVRQYDWYSLGIVLLEIGFWTTIDLAMKDHENEPNAEFAQNLIREKLPLLAFHMGIGYAEIVQYCLTCSNKKLQENNSTAISSNQYNLIFQKNIVLPLQILASRHSAQEQQGVIRKRKSTPDWDKNPHGSSKRIAL